MFAISVYLCGTPWFVFCQIGSRHSAGVVFNAIKPKWKNTILIWKIATHCPASLCGTSGAFNMTWTKRSTMSILILIWHMISVGVYFCRTPPFTFVVRIHRTTIECLTIPFEGKDAISTWIRSTNGFASYTNNFSSLCLNLNSCCNQYDGKYYQRFAHFHSISNVRICL